MSGRIYAYSQANPGKTIPEIAEAMGILSQRADNIIGTNRSSGIAYPTGRVKIFSRKIPVGSEKEKQAIRLLTETILPIYKICETLGASYATLEVINLKHNCRNGFFLKSRFVPFGINAERLKQTLRKLGLGQLNPITPKEQERIFRGKKHLLDQEAAKYPLGTLRHEFNELLHGQLRFGLKEYRPELCSERHFALLVALNTKIRFTRKNVKERYMNNLFRMGKANEIGTEERNRIVEQHLEELNKYVHSLSDNPDWREEIFQETMLASLAGFDKYNPRAHGSPLEFMKAVAKSVVKDRKRRHFTEKRMLEQLAGETMTQMRGYLSAKPKNTDLRKQFEE